MVAPLHGFDPMHPPSFDRNLVQGAITLGYTLFDGGARGARIRQAEAGERAVEAGGASTRMAVSAQVGAAYLGVLTGEELLAAVLGQKAALSEELQRVRLFLEEGKAARVDLLRVEAALSRVEAQEISVRSELESGPKPGGSPHRAGGRGGGKDDLCTGLTSRDCHSGQRSCSGRGHGE